MKPHIHSGHFSIVFEDNHLLVVNKRPGILVQGDHTGDLPLSELAKDYLREKYNKPGNIFCGVIHRLDRPVSGLVALAKTSKSLERMNALFRDRKIKKTYWALTGNIPEPAQGTLVHYLLKYGAKNISKAFKKEVAHSLRSELNYQYLGAAGKYHLLEVDPLTGRHHQIRSQLAAINCPIVSDVKYRFPELILLGHIGLHARMLSFEHPISKENLTLQAEPPKNEIWAGVFADKY